MKVAFITGITGQDGSYLAELLLEKEYVVYGMIRRSSSFNTGRINHIFDRLNLRYGDLTDSVSIINILTEIKNKYWEDLDVLEIYNLAAMSHVKVSFEMPMYVGQSDGLGVLNLLEGIRNLEISKKTRLYQASTSEMFGKVQTVPQNEFTPFYPRSPYGVAKLYAHWIVKNYRESYNMFACSGLLFNHESERRGETFVTRKITRGISSIISGDLKFISLGNIDAKRDWGYAPDYVKGMWLMLQQDSPDDYVLATNEYHTVREFVEKSFNYVGIKIKWQGSGVNEVGINESTGDILIKINEKYFRPAEVEELLGDYSKAYEKLGWIPETKFEKLVEIMMDYDLSIEKNKKNYYNKEGRFSFGEPCPPLPKQIFFKRENNDEHTSA